MPLTIEQNFLLLEGDLDTPENWRIKLRLDAEGLSFLITQGVFQRSRNKDGKSRLRLNMVGLLSTKERSFFCLPKIFRSARFDVTLSMIDALSVVQTYHKHIKRGPDASRIGEADVFFREGSSLDHFLGLWEWTRKFGLHRDTVAVKDNEFKAINWRSTIFNTLAVHQPGSIIYPEPIGEKLTSSLSRLGLIQALALKELNLSLGNVIGIWADKHDPIWDYCEEAIFDSSLYIQDPVTIFGVIDEYEITCSRDADKELVELLKAYFESSYRRSPLPDLYGVSSFHTVWEHMCAFIFDGLGELIVHSSVASQPTYTLQNKSFCLEPQRPDILCATGDGMIIGDAKWYIVDLGELPSTPDAIKQFSYYTSVIDHSSVIGNYLFLPTLSNDSFAHLGSLNMKHESNDDHRFLDVQIVGLSWRMMVDLYSNYRDISHPFLEWLIGLPSIAVGEPSIFVS